MDESRQVSQGEELSSIALAPGGRGSRCCTPDDFDLIKPLTRRPALPTIAPAFHCVIGASLVPAGGAR